MWVNHRYDTYKTGLTVLSCAAEKLARDSSQLRRAVSVYHSTSAL